MIHSYYLNQHHSVNPHGTGDVSKFIPAIVINNQTGVFMGYGVDGRFHNIGEGKWRVMPDLGLKIHWLPQIHI